MSSYEYPKTRRAAEGEAGFAEEEFFGTKVQDPYRWLEDNNSDETKAWIESENKFTQELLDKIPYRKKLQDDMTRLYNYEKFGTPWRVEDHFYYFHNTGLQNQYVLWRRGVNEDAKSNGEVFFDPNKLSEDGTVALGEHAFSRSGKLWAYALSKSGSDWNTIKVRNTETGEDLSDTIPWVKFSSISWTHDSEGFFYAKYDAPAGVAHEGDQAGTETEKVENHKVYYHRIGTDAEKDILIYKDTEHSLWMFGVSVSECGEYAILGMSDGCKPENRVSYALIKDLLSSEDPVNTFTHLIDNWDWKYDYVTNFGTEFYFITTNNAPRNRLIKLDIKNAAPENWVEIIPHSEGITGRVLVSVALANKDKLMIEFRQDVVDYLYIFSLDGKEEKKFDTGIGSLQAITCDSRYTEVFFKFTSFLTPGRVYEYNFDTKETSVFKDTVLEGFDPDVYESKQVFYDSKGARIPLFIVHRKGLKTPSGCILYGYGGFNVPMAPSFSSSRITLLQHFDVVYALACIRGGGEYGEEWYKAGRLSVKQNCFDDFRSAGHWLIDNGYTTKDKLTIQGGSNGGTLVLACANQEPDLFAAVLAQVGVLDMLRFHKFTIGHAWTSDYGCADTSKEEFDNLMTYSPYHNVPKPEKNFTGYPATLLLTGDHDDRVVPLHSFKCIAELQYGMPNNQRPLAIRVETKAGHGAGKPTAKIIEEAADMYSFALYNTGMEWRD